MNDAVHHGIANRQQLRGLVLATGTYLLATFCLEILDSTPASYESAPIEISTDIVAALGFLYAAFRVMQVWKHVPVRRIWFYGCGGMFLIWCAESGIDRLSTDYRIAIAVWAAATVLLFHGMQSYATRSIIPRIMGFSFLAQAVAHGTWITLAELPEAVRWPDVTLELVADTGELISLTFCILAFVMARHSGLDELVIHGDARLRAWASKARRGTVERQRPRLCFPLIAQIHQTFHVLPIAAALAQRYPEIDVHVAALESRLDDVRMLARRNAADARLRFDSLHLAWPGRLLDRLRVGFAKILTLRGNRHYFSGFDAVVVPERTSTYLRRINPQIRLVGTEHGAGDRAVTWSAQVANYDFLLLPGEKQARHLLELGYVKPGRFASGIYAKLDWALRGNAEPRLFDNDRVTVLYNPHFDQRLSSWRPIGRQVLDYFANSAAYNLIFAPHIRMFDPPTLAKRRTFSRYQGLPHMLIDLGSVRSADMTYTRAADIYLGDVSSQVVEYIVQPRPCIFLNPRRIQWQGDLHYRFWNLGTVVENIAELDSALAVAKPLPDQVRRSQQDYLRDTLGEMEPGTASARGADAIVQFLRMQVH